MLILILIAIFPLFFTPFRVGNPYFVISLFLVVFFAIKFFVINSIGEFFLLGLKSSSILNEVNYMVWYLIIAYTISAILIYYKKTKKRANRKFEDYHVKSIAYTITIILPILLLLLAVSKGINPLTQPLQMRQFSESNGMFYVLAPINFLIYLTVIQFLRYVEKKKMPPLKIAIATGVSITFALLSGIGSTIIICFGLYVVYLSALKRIKVEKLMFLCIPILMLYAVIQNQYRISRIDVSNNVKIIDLVTDLDVSNVLFATMFNRFDYMEMYSKGHEYLLKTEPDYGESFITAFFQVVPRGLWPDKPFNTSSYLSRKIIPDVVSEVGSTANFNSLNEFTRAFGGALGVCVGGIIFGLIIGSIYLEFSSSFGAPYYALKYATVLFLFCFLGFTAGYINDQAPQLLLINYLLFRLFVKGRKVATIA